MKTAEEVFKEKGMKEIGSQANAITFKPGEYIVGVLTEIRENVGPNHSKMYIIEDEADGQLKAVWGTTVLDARISSSWIGREIGITYKGKATGDRGQYHDYGVFVVPNKVEQEHDEKVKFIDANTNEEVTDLPF